MPIWPVSLTDGIYQVADADGALYPLMMNGAPVSRFNEGWTPRGLQTGIPPFHLLELEHVDGSSAIWLQDDTLDHRANAVLHLRPDDLAGFFSEMDPVAVILNEECVRAPHAAIPAAAHRFDGLLPATVRELIGPSVGRALAPPETVILSNLRALGTGFARNGISLSADWIEAALSATEQDAQESFDLPGHRCQRHLDQATGRVFYVLTGAAADDRHLFVPSLPVVISPAPSTHDPLLLLIIYYASHTNRAVSLPEAEGLEPGLVEVVPAAQHGLDEPMAPEPASVEHDEPATHGEVPHGVPPGVPAEEVPPYQAPRYEEPDREIPAYPREQAYLEPGFQEAVDRQPVGTTSGSHGPAERLVEAAPKQNWWQRLLGLGNG